MEDIVIAIDASTKSSGIAIYENKELIKYLCITQSSKDVLKRIKGMTDEIEKLYQEYKDNNVQVIIEQIIPDNLNDDNAKWTKNQATFKALFYLQAAIVLMFHSYNIEVEFIGASSWRKQCGIKQGGIKRDTLKQKDIEFVKDVFGLTVNDDVADAICIGYAKIHQQPEPKPFEWT